MPETLIEPFRIKSIEPIRMTTRAERQQLLEAPAVGLDEGMQEDHLRYRLHIAEYLCERLEASGVGFVKPTGGHAV